MSEVLDCFVVLLSVGRQLVVVFVGGVKQGRNVSEMVSQVSTETHTDRYQPGIRLNINTKTLTLLNNIVFSTIKSYTYCIIYPPYHCKEMSAAKRKQQREICS